MLLLRLLKLKSLLLLLTLLLQLLQLQLLHYCYYNYYCYYYYYYYYHYQNIHNKRFTGTRRNLRWIYRIPCKDCEKTYTGADYTDLKHKRKNIKRRFHLDTRKSALAEHHTKIGHDISWDNYKLLHTCDKWKQRKIMEAWGINLEPNCMNRDDGANLPSEHLRLIVTRAKKKEWYS